MEKSLIKISNRLRWVLLILPMLAFVLGCNKVSLVQHSDTFIKTYKTDTSATAISLTQMPDGGFIIISSEGAGQPLMIRTNKYGILQWNKAIQENGFQPFYANAFLLADGSNFVAHCQSNIYKFDTLGEIKNSVSIPNPNYLTFDDMSHLGSDFMLPACSSQFGGASESYIYVYDENLIPVRQDSFKTAGIGGEIFGLSINGLSSSGTYNISGMIYPRVNWTTYDVFKLFSAVIPTKGKVTETMIDSGDQTSADIFVPQILTVDSEEILLGERFSSTTSIYYPIVVKFDKKLNLIWEKEFPVLTASINPYSLRLCKDGGFIISGDIGNTGTLYTQPYILKIDKDGNKQWDKTITSASLEGSGIFYSGTELIDGSFAFVGSSSQFGKGLNGIRVLFVKTDANGNL